MITNRKIYTLALFTSLMFFGCKNNNTDATKENSPETQITETPDEPEVQTQLSDFYNNTNDSFSKDLGQQGYLGNITFKVWTDVVDGNNPVVKVQPSGYEAVNDESMLEYQGKVYDAFIDDMNGDGFPELFILTVNKENQRHVIGYASNSNKSMSGFYFTPTVDNSQINSGYSGGDAFTAIEGKLAHQFPVYENGQPTGKTRQIVYKMVPGEAGYLFKVDSVNEF